MLYASTDTPSEMLWYRHACCGYNAWSLWSAVEIHRQTTIFLLCGFVNRAAQGRSRNHRNTASQRVLAPATEHRSSVNSMVQWKIGSTNILTIDWGWANGRRTLTSSVSLWEGVANNQCWRKMKNKANTFSLSVRLPLKQMGTCEFFVACYFQDKAGCTMWKWSIEQDIVVPGEAWRSHGRRRSVSTRARFTHLPCLTVACSMWHQQGFQDISHPFLFENLFQSTKISTQELALMLHLALSPVNEFCLRLSVSEYSLTSIPAQQWCCFWKASLLGQITSHGHKLC